MLLATTLLPARAGDAALPHAAPADVGMSAERLAVIDRVVGKAIDAGGFPGAAVVVGRHGAVVWERGYGVLGGGSTAPVDPERTPFDLASLTKVVATSAAAMVLVDQGRLGLDEPVARYLPEFRGGAKARVTIRHLLRHRSGLPAGRALPANPTEARRRVLGTALEAEPGTRYEYSDLGPIVLGFVIERVTGEPLDRFVRHAVYEPLGMHATTFRPERALAARTAATERGVPRGEVHDRTAHALGGVAGHAGLFATAGDLAIFAQFMLDGGRRGDVRLVGDSTVATFTRRGPEDRQALGWETCAGGGSCGHRLSRAAFGHTGFTGTSLWIDPERDLFVIVLTNWVAGRPGGGVAPTAVLHDVRADVADIAALAVVDSVPAAMPDRMRSDARIGW
jgi:CubicO group peptidase (beta-lactamase class C family)